MENQSSASASTATSSMDFLILQQVKFLEISDDPLSHWELVDLLDAHENSDSVAVTVTDTDTDAYSLLPDDDDDDAFAFTSWGSSSVSWSSAPIISNAPVLRHPHAPDAEKKVRDVVNRPPHFADDNGDDEEDDDEDDEAFELNDELVPWEVSRKFGRQRMRKLGKRVCPKMNSSKRSPTLFVTPGSLRGKHGLGLKHNL